MMRVVFLLYCLVAGALCHYYDNPIPYQPGPVLNYGYGRDLGFSGYTGYRPGLGNFIGSGVGDYGLGSFGRGYGSRFMRRNPVIGGY